MNTEQQAISDDLADEKKTVPLGPEDVPPGSVFRVKQSGLTRSGYCIASCVDFDGCEFSSRKSQTLVGWSELHEEWRINRSIPLTGKWDANAWEPCSKQV